VAMVEPPPASVSTAPEPARSTVRSTLLPLSAT
jgi:hypothetical protein